MLLIENLRYLPTSVSSTQSRDKKQQASMNLYVCVCVCVHIGINTQKPQKSGYNMHTYTSFLIPNCNETLSKRFRKCEDIYVEKCTD